MPIFDATKPAANTLVSSSELRDRFIRSTTLGALSTTVSTNDSTVWAQFHQMNNNRGPVATLPTAFTDPISAADLEVLRAKLNEVIAASQAFDAGVNFTKVDDIDVDQCFIGLQPWNPA